MFGDHFDDDTNQIALSPNTQWLHTKIKTDISDKDKNGYGDGDGDGGGVDDEESGCWALSPQRVTVWWHGGHQWSADPLLHSALLDSTTLLFLRYSAWSVHLSQESQATVPLCS